MVVAPSTAVTARKLTSKLTANPAKPIQISPAKLNLLQRTDVSNDAIGEAYTFTRSFGGEFGHLYQSSASGWKLPKIGYICDFVHEVMIHRSGAYIIVEHEARVVLRNTSTVKEAYTFKNGKRLHAPLFSLDLNSGGYPIGPGTPHHLYGNNPGAMFPVFVEFGKIGRGQNAMSKRVTMRFKTDKALSSIDDVVLFSPWLSTMAIK